MKPNNVFHVPCTDTSFFRAWIEFLAPYHKLTSRERDVAARILLQHFKLASYIDDPEVLKDVLWSRNSREDIRNSLKMSVAHFQMILGKLKTSGFLKEGDVDPRYLPHKTDDPRLMLCVVFDWSSKENPIRRETQ